MVDIRDLAERIWNGEVSTQEVHPVAWRQPEGQEIAPGMLYYKGIAGANTIDTGDGLVMLDTGARNDTEPLHEDVRNWRPDARLRAAVFSHHHVDHIFGVGRFEPGGRRAKGWPRPLVYGHELLGCALRPLQEDASAGTRPSTAASSPSTLARAFHGRTTTATPT